MGIARKLLLSGCALALVAMSAEAAGRKAPAPKCAKPSEYAAMQVIAIQQELMDAALTCGEDARNGYNQFQIGYRPLLKKYDNTMLTMFRRLQGGKKGDAAYNLFKTDLATKAEFRRIQHSPNFCAAAAVKVQAALAPDAAALEDFAALASVEDFAWPFEDCSVLETRDAMPDIMPQPNPVRLAAEAAAPAPVETPPDAPPPAPADNTVPQS